MDSTVDQARDVLNVVLAVAGLASAGSIVGSWRLSGEDERMDVARSWASVALAVLALVLGLVTTILMAPIAWTSILINRGDPSGLLVAFNLLFLLAVGFLIAALVALARAATHVFKVYAAYRTSR